MTWAAGEGDAACLSRSWAGRLRARAGLLRAGLDRGVFAPRAKGTPRAGPVRRAGPGVSRRPSRTGDPRRERPGGAYRPGTHVARHQGQAGRVSEVVAPQKEMSRSPSPRRFRIPAVAMARSVRSRLVVLQVGSDVPLSRRDEGSTGLPDGQVGDIVSACCKNWIGVP